MKRSDLDESLRIWAERAANSKAKKADIIAALHAKADEIAKAKDEPAAEDQGSAGKSSFKGETGTVKVSG